MEARWIPWLFAVSLLVSGCCSAQARKQGPEEEDGAKPGAASTLPHHAPVTQHRPAGPKPKVPVVGECRVNAPPFSNGTPRRGIVRTAPNFQAPEVARLNNGTALTLISSQPGGWYQVAWPVGVNSSNGFIHGDILDVTLYDD